MHNALPGFSVGCERPGLFIFSPLVAKENGQRLALPPHVKCKEEMQ